jgi:hypothetical protein
MSISIREKTTTLIFLALQLVHHFIEGTGIDTTDVNAITVLVLVLSSCVLTYCCVSALPWTWNQQAVSEIRTSVDCRSCGGFPTLLWSKSLKWCIKKSCLWACIHISSKVYSRKGFHMLRWIEVSVLDLRRYCSSGRHVMESRGDRSGGEQHYSEVSAFEPTSKSLIPLWFLSFHEIPFVSVIYIHFFAPKRRQFIAVMAASTHLWDIHLYGYQRKMFCRGRPLLHYLE